MIEPYTEEWKQARLGKVTGSRLADVTARTKTTWGASRANYMTQLLIERLTGTVADTYTSEAMQWGIDHEQDAIAAYMFRYDREVIPAGFRHHPTIQASGSTPDGIVDLAGALEVKCPNSATHVETLLNGTIPDKYLKQMQWHMVCTGLEWCDFVSFDPRMPVSMQLWAKRVERDGKLLDELERDVMVFLRELDEKCEALVTRYEVVSQLNAQLKASLERTDDPAYLQQKDG